MRDMRADHFEAFGIPPNGMGFDNKKLCRAFSRQANGFTLNIPVLQGFLRVNGKAEKDP